MKIPLAFLVVIALLMMPWTRPLSAAPTAGTVCGPHATYTLPVPGHPFAIAEMGDGSAAFVALTSGQPKQLSGIGVLKCISGRYQFSHLVPLEASPSGMAMTHDGKLLVVADDGFVAFVDIGKALRGKDALAGYLQTLDGSVEDNDPGEVYVNITSDDRTAFVSDENNATITVIDLQKARSNGFNRSSIIGQIESGNAPIALTFSGDGKYLYTTSEVGRKKYNWDKTCRPEGSPPDTALAKPAGAIITVDVAKARTDPAHAIVSTIASDCSPVRMVISPDSSTVWVSNRASDSVTAFSTAKLNAGDPAARIATIKVGSNPVGIGITPDGRYILVGNTNRFGPGGTAHGTVSVIDSGTKTVAATIPAGMFPREFSPGKQKLFLSNNRSDTITVFNVAKIIP